MSGLLSNRAFELSTLRPIRMRITTDLTRYHVGLVSGAEGTTQFKPAPSGIWCFFPNVGWWDIVEGKGFEIIDGEYLQLKAEDNADELAAVRSAVSATLFLGPQRGFHGLRIECGNGKQALMISDRKTADKYKQVLQEAGVAIHEHRETMRGT